MKKANYITLISRDQKKAEKQGQDCCFILKKGEKVESIDHLPYPLEKEDK